MKKLINAYQVIAVMLVVVLFNPFAFAADVGDSSKSDASSNLSVDPGSGTASISIPISVQQGRAGVQPNINLFYNSSVGNGLVGVGWSMDLGNIQRSTRKRIPQYNNSDTFVFSQAGSNQTLVDISGSGTEFRPETEGAFSKIQFSNSSWIVTDKKGTKYFFGTTASSRVADPNNSAHIFKWCLERVEDINGNYLTITYLPVDNQLYPQEILYTGNTVVSLSPYASVKFLYETKPNIADKTISYNAGFKISQTQRLNAIEVRAENNLIRKYNMNYASAPLTGKSFLNNVAVIGSDGFTTIPATKMTYNTPSYDMNSVVNLTNSPTVGMSGRVKMLDMNNDGLPDIVDGAASNYTVRINQSKDGNVSFADPVAVGNSPTVSADDAKVRLIDLNSDGLLDFIYLPAGASPSVWINTGASSFTKMPTSPITIPNGGSQFIDMNNDGYPDLVMIIPPYIQSGRPVFTPFLIYMNDGNGNFSAYIQAQNSTFSSLSLNMANDFNGDGLADLIWGSSASGYNIRFNNGINGYSSPKSITSFPAIDITRPEVRIDDINGDGLADLLVTGSTYTLYINNGQGDFNPGITMTNAPTIGTDNNAVKIMDYNGDHLPDVVVGIAPYKVYFNDGNSGFLPAITLTNYPSLGLDNLNTAMVDINGDGLLDFVSGEASNYKVWLNSPNIQNAQGNALVNVDNAIGGRMELTYQNLPVKGWGNIQYLNAASRSLLSAVKTIGKRASPTDTLYVTKYEYTGGLWDFATREFRGFKTVKVIDADGNYSLADYGQDNIYKGKPLTQSTYDSQDRLFSKSVNTWANQVLYPGVNFSFLQQTDSYIYDGDSTGRRTQARYFYEESPQYGNVTKTINFGEVDLNTGADIGTDKSTTEISYHNNTTNWVLGLPKVITIKDNADVQFSKTTFYYDSNTDFNVLPTKGFLTKKEGWAGDAPDTIQPFLKYTYDNIGNLLTTSDNNNSTTVFSYDPTYKMFQLTVTNALTHTVTNEYYGVNGVALSGGDGTFGLWGQLKSITDPNQKKGLQIYDALGRTVKMVSPVDTIAFPTVSYEYIYGTSQFICIGHQRITSGAAPTMDTVEFYDGLWRVVETKSKAATSGQFIIGGQTEYNSRGLPIKKYDSRLTTTSMTESDPIDTNQLFSSISYDAMGRTIKTTSPDGSYANVVYDDWTTTSYDENGHMQKSYADALGHLIKKEEYFGADGRHAAYPASTYSLYATTLYTYDPRGNLVKSQDAKGNLITLKYDTLGRKIEMTDPDMGTWKYGYDVVGNLIWQEDAKGKRINFTYDQAARLKSKTDLSVMTVNYTYDDVNAQNTKGRFTSASYGGGNHSVTYDDVGRELQSIKSIGSTNFSVKRTYDALDRIVSLEYPDGSPISYTYNDVGQTVKVLGKPIPIPVAPTILMQPANVTVTAGSTATFSVVATGTALTYQWYSSVNDGPFTAIAGQTSWSRTTGAVSITDNGNKYKCVVSGSAGSVTSNVVTLTVNPAVLPSITTQPVDLITTAGSTTTFEVVATGNPKPTYQWMQKAVGVSTFTAISGATKACYTTPVTTVANSGTTYKVIVTNVGGSITSNEVTLTVNSKPTDLTITTQPGNVTVVASYQATLTVVASGTIPTYQWQQAAPGSNTYTDIAGATSASYLIPITTLANNGTKYKVILTNASGSVVSNVATVTVVSWPMENVTSPANNSTFTAGTDITLTANASEANGTIVNVVFYNGTTALGSSSVAPYSYTFKNIQVGTYYFNVKAQDAKGTYSQSPSIKVTVNPPVTINNEYIKNVEYNVAGQMTKLEYGNGVVTTYTYYPTTLLLTNMKTVNATGTMLQNFSYTYDGIGNITAITDSVNMGSQTFKYDALNRLIQATGVQYGQKDYTYDQIGNILTKDGLTYTYSKVGAGPHAVTSLSDGTTITYDANGNMSTKSRPGEVMEYIYDSENRLVQVKKNMTVIAEYLYDGDGGRVQKTAWLVKINGSLQVVSTPVVTKYVGGLYEQTDNVGTKIITLGSQRIAAIDTASGLPLYYHGDHLGSTNVTTDDKGVQAEIIEYDPWGKIVRDTITPGSRVAKQQFTGKKLDDETGLYYFNARYYDPILGKFTTPDTIIQDPSNPQTLNRYSYCGNNPINNIDPSGHSFWKKWGSKIFGAIIAITLSILLTPAVGAIWAGAIGGAVGGAMSGAIDGGWKGALIGAVTGGALGALGGWAFGGTTPSPTPGAGQLAKNEINVTIVDCWPTSMGQATGAGSGAATSGSTAGAVLGKAIGGAVGAVGGAIASGLSIAAQTIKSWPTESVLPGPWGQPVSQWKNGAPTGWGDPMGVTENAGGGWMWAERISFYGSGLAVTGAAGAGMLSAGSETIVFSGQGSYTAAMNGVANGFGRTIFQTPGGRLLQFIEEKTGRKLAQGVWDNASRIFIRNAKGTVRGFLNNPDKTRVFTRIEEPFLKAKGIPLETYGPLAW